MNGIVSVAREPGNLADSAAAADMIDGVETLASIGAPLPDGYFVGEHARGL